jgi:hypothetical protein
VNRRGKPIAFVKHACDPSGADIITGDRSLWPGVYKFITLRGVRAAIEKKYHADIAERAMDYFESMKLVGQVYMSSHPKPTPGEPSLSDRVSAARPPSPLPTTKMTPEKKRHREASVTINKEEEEEESSSTVLSSLDLPLVIMKNTDSKKKHKPDDAAPAESLAEKMGEQIKQNAMLAINGCINSLHKTFQDTLEERMQAYYDQQKPLIDARIIAEIKAEIEKKKKEENDPLFALSISSAMSAAAMSAMLPGEK